ncbi:multidrug effflux MFS transporter [Aurantimonas sp. HBX-1]|nr:multidrug effflux MFS transporter [Aurantimonas sp. HBX-1]UIJ71974.1 multidrug effflux MFS transporter [Aurantimonas sp. HBX-1]
MPPSTVPPATMSQRRTALIGGCLVAIGPISLALYTPAMPVLVDEFGTTESMIKLTLSVYFAGFALTQLVCGPVSDAFGRRFATLAFMVVYVAGSALAVAAPNVETLIAARLLQGIGASVGVTTARAIVRDQFSGETSSQIMNAIGIILAIGPAVSPTLGGLTLALAGWNAIFVLMMLCGLIVVGVTLGFMRETGTPDRSRIRPGAILRAYGRLATHRQFLATSLTVAGAVGALYTLATVLPFVLIDRAGLSPTQFGVGMLAQSGMFLGGSLAVRYAMARTSAYRLVPVGLGFIAAGSAALALSIALLPISYLSVMAPVGLYAFGIAFVMPAMTTASLAPFRDMAGAAAAMMGFIQTGAGLAGSALAALIGEPVLATQIIIPGLGLTAISAYLVHRASAPAALPEPRPLVPAPELPRGAGD